jgi:Uma2 family endonuclease
MALPKYPVMSVEDYLTLDRSSKSARYEYLDGELKMLAGGSAYHSAIIANLTGVLSRFLEESSCWVYNSDIRLQLSETRYVYPDITISCDRRDQELDDMIHYPCLVVEVLSPTTEATDRGEKFFYYQDCPTIQDYVLVDSLSIRIEVYHREEDGWKLRTYGPGSIVQLEHLDIHFSISAVYRGMNLTGSRKNQKKR